MRRQLVHHFASLQQADGSFVAWSSPTIQPFTPLRKQPSIFQTILIAEAIKHIPELASVHKKACNFVANQRRTDGSWTYWRQNAKQQQTEPYPPDLDDTACAMALLADRQTPQQMAQLAHLLTRAEQVPGGPYTTWLCDWQQQPQWLDVDPAVNANIAYMLKRLGIQLEPLKQYLAAAELGSSYYVGQAPLYYFYARAGIDSIGDSLAARLQTLKKLTDLETALLLSAGCNISIDTALLQPLYDKLVRFTGAHWPAEALYVDPVYDGRQHYGGSAALTTALALEALHLFEQKIMVRLPVQRPLKLMAKAETLSLSSPQLRRRYRSELAKVAASPQGGAISHAANLMATTSRAKIKPPILQALNLGSLHGWLAYTIYDNIMDGDGNAADLPLANIALRRSYDRFLGALPDPAWQHKVKQTFDTMDTANDWEMHHTRCRADVKRLPDFKDLSVLAQRSLGHSLAAHGTLLAAGYPLNHAVQKHMANFFHHFLIARQLNDDAHDWEIDLTAGRLSPVIVWLLQNQPLPVATEPSPKLRQIFWHDTIDVVQIHIETHLRAAKEALDRLPKTFNLAIFEDWLAELSGTTQAAIQERNDTRQFIAAFQGKED